MITSFVSRRSVAIPFALAIQVLLAAGAAPEEKSAEGPAEGPLLIALAPAKPDPTEYDLRYKLKRGDVLRYEVTHRASIQSTIDGTTQAAQTRTDSVKVWKVIDTLPSGEIEFTNVVERVHMVNQLPDREPAEYDSERDKTPPAGFEDAARSVGVPLSVVRITPRGKIARRDMKVRGENLEEDTQIVVRLPEKPVAIGDTWDEPFDVQVTLENGGAKSVQTRRHHKLAGVSSGIATIEVTYQVLSPMDAHIESQLVQRLMEGEVRFDIEAGRVAGQQIDVDKRILGFAGPTSSMQYVMRMEEKLLTTDPKLAGKSSRNSTTSQSRSPRATPTRTANGQRSQPGTRSYRR